MLAIWFRHQHWKVFVFVIAWELTCRDNCHHAQLLWNIAVLGIVNNWAERKNTGYPSYHLTLSNNFFCPNNFCFCPNNFCNNLLLLQLYIFPHIIMFRKYGNNFVYIYFLRAIICAFSFADWKSDVPSIYLVLKHMLCLRA